MLRQWLDRCIISHPGCFSLGTCASKDIAPLQNVHRFIFQCSVWVRSVSMVWTVSTVQRIWQRRNDETIFFKTPGFCKGSNASSSYKWGHEWFMHVYSPSSQQICGSCVSSGFPRNGGPGPKQVHAWCLTLHFASLLLVRKGGDVSGRNQEETRRPETSGKTWPAVLEDIGIKDGCFHKTYFHITYLYRY